MQLSQLRPIEKFKSLLPSMSRQTVDGIILKKKSKTSSSNTVTSTASHLKHLSVSLSTNPVITNTVKIREVPQVESSSTYQAPGEGRMRAKLAYQYLMLNQT
jgi:hypothetical protein